MSDGIAGARSRAFMLVQKAASTPYKRIAAKLNKDESVISRIVSGEVGIKIHDIHDFVDALDHKIVPKTHVCVDREEYWALQVLAGRRPQLQKAPKLLWPEEEDPE